MENSLMQIVEKWELENAKLKPYLNAFGGTLPKNSMVAHMVRNECIRDIKQYLNNQLKNRANDTKETVCS
jgi:hypothetical protein